MLFAYNNFWRRLLFIAASWCFYGIFGFELTVVTVLSLIYINKN
tara:strand:+ start:378 stop:509 length:132 start_codon:yes stop_codon:yes gene_type:complete